MRVMTWNLWWRFGPWELRHAAIAAVIDSQQPDVVLLQEVWGAEGTSAAHRLASELGYHVAITDDPFGGRDVGFHNAILSRWPLDDVQSHPLPGLDGTPGHRRVLVARVETPWGAWPMMSTHFDYRFDQSALRVAQARALLDLVSHMRGQPDVDLPVVACGDLNAVPDSDEIRLLTGRTQGHVSNLVMTDCWESVGDAPGFTWRRENPYQTETAWPNRRLDYVLVSWPRPKPIGNPISAWLAGLAPVAGIAPDVEGGVVPSDHAAVVVDLRTPDAPTTAG